MVGYTGQWIIRKNKELEQLISEIWYGAGDKEKTRTIDKGIHGERKGH